MCSIKGKISTTHILPHEAKQIYLFDMSYSYQQESEFDVSKFFGVGVGAEVLKREAWSRSGVKSLKNLNLLISVLDMPRCCKYNLTFCNPVTWSSWNLSCNCMQQSFEWLLVQMYRTGLLHRVGCVLSLTSRSNQGRPTFEVKLHAWRYCHQHNCSLKSISEFIYRKLTGHLQGKSGSSV